MVDADAEAAEDTDATTLGVHVRGRQSSRSSPLHEASDRHVQTCTRLMKMTDTVDSVPSTPRTVPLGESANQFHDLNLSPLTELSSIPDLVVHLVAIAVDSVCVLGGLQRLPSVN